MTELQKARRGRQPSDTCSYDSNSHNFIFNKKPYKEYYYSKFNRIKDFLLKYEFLYKL